MSRMCIKIEIDVTKIKKERLYEGKKGTYLKLTSFIDPDNPNEYENIGFVTQSITPEEQDHGVKMPILGNVKCIWREEEKEEICLKEDSEINKIPF